MAIGSFFLLPFILAVAALFVASAARRNIERSGGALGGDALVTWSRVLAWINIVLCVLALVAAVLFWSYVANELQTFEMQ